MEKENEKGLSTCVEGNLSEDDMVLLDTISLDENFAKVVKLTNSLVNKLYNKPTTKEKVFPAVFVLNKDNLKKENSLVIVNKMVLLATGIPFSFVKTTE